MINKKSSKYQYSNKLIINRQKETERIVDFIRITMKKAGFEKVVVGVSGGVDSATVLSLCIKALGAENVYALMMPCGEIKSEEKKSLDKLFDLLKLPEKNRREIDIKQIVDTVTAQSAKFNPFDKSSTPRSLRLEELRTSVQNQAQSSKLIINNKIRIGNIIARARMIVLCDLAKQLDALVCGTENKSEYLLGYYTRFGDEASDLEPIWHLYKMQVYQLAKYLGVPEIILKKIPTAGLWEGQTDEEELGFTYSVADEWLFRVFENNVSWEEIKNQKSRFDRPPCLGETGEARRAKTKNIDQRLKTLKTIELIENRVKANWFKKEVPYIITGDKLTRHKQQVKGKKYKVKNGDKLERQT